MFYVIKSMETFDLSVYWNSTVAFMCVSMYSRAVVTDKVCTPPPLHSLRRQVCEIGVDTAGVYTDHTCVHARPTLTLRAGWIKLVLNCLVFSFLVHIILVTQAGFASQKPTFNTLTQTWVPDLTFKLSLKHIRDS